MKTLRLIGITLVVIFACVNLTCCSKDNDSFKNANDTIIYKTTDGNTIYFENEDVFGGAIITSNTYSVKDGYGVIKLSSKVISIDNYAFYNQDRLSTIILPNSVVRIKDSAFRDCRNLTSFTIGNNIRSIGRDAFANCSNLLEVHISDLDAWFRIDFSDGENPLSCHKSWSSEIVSTGLYLKGELITDLVIPSTVTHIKDRALEDCISFTSVTIPDSIIEIGCYAFGGCNGLTSVLLGNRITRIEVSAFYGCSGLTTITIPESVTEIGYDAFGDCTGLTSMYVKATIPAKPTDAPIVGVAGSDISYRLGCEDATLYVPKGSLETYKAADGWCKFKNIQEWDVY